MITALSLLFAFTPTPFWQMTPVLFAPPANHSAKKSANPYRLMQAKTFSFDAVLWDYETGDDGKPRLTKSRTISVKVAQPGSLCIDEPISRLVRMNTTSEIVEVGKYDFFVSDGKTQYSFSKLTRNCLVEKAIPRLSMYEGIVFDLPRPEFLFLKDPIKEIALKFTGETRLRGESALVYKLDLHGPTGAIQFRFYLAKKTGLPMQLSEFDKDKSGNWIEVERTEYVNWVVNPKFPASTFDTTPPPGAKIVAPKAPGK